MCTKRRVYHTVPYHTIPYHTIPYQIPACPEQGAALAQLHRDGGSDVDNVAPLEFQVREATPEEMNDTTTGRDRSQFGVAPFFTPCGPLRALGPGSGELDFSVRAPTTSKNLYRVLRALQVYITGSA